MGMVTAPSRADNAAMEALAGVDRELADEERDYAALALLAQRVDGRATAALVRKMAARQERVRVYISTATGTTLLMLPYRQHETLPRVREDALP